jgi:hypothetical protein
MKFGNVSRRDLLLACYDPASLLSSMERILESTSITAWQTVEREGDLCTDKGAF